MQMERAAVGPAMMKEMLLWSKVESGQTHSERFGSQACDGKKSANSDVDGFVQLKC
jgi:hypothetical protein